MGTYLNPGNSAFARALTQKYIDKTSLISVINGTINTAKNLTCISRPRRFGKSYAAQMLCAYYDRTVDSHEMFAPWKISSLPGYEEHINKYNVIYLDMAGIKSFCDNYRTLVPYVKERITLELSLSNEQIRIDTDF